MHKKIVFLLAFVFMANVSYSQPSFALVGYGVGTTGGQGGSTVTVTDYAGLAAAVVGTTSTIINVSGTITGPSGGQILDVGSNKSFIGVGCNAKISMVQLHLKNSSNIIIQNIIFSMVGSTLGSDADMICMETTTSTVDHIWVDHCEFYNIKPTLPETAAKKDLYDGMIDIKKSCSYITLSWNYFHDHWKCNLIGYTDTDVYDRKITFHHNYWKNIKSRAPSYRGGTGHVYNNYYDGLLIEDESAPGVWVGTLVSTGVHTREQACLKVENNYFKNYDKTIYNDIADCTFEGYAHGAGNIFDNSIGQTATTCASFATGYAYTMDVAVNVPAIVSMWSGVGKINGTAPVLSSPANKDQTPAGAINTIVFSWAGTATGVTVTGLPTGLTGVTNAGAKTYTINGTPSASGTYTVTTTGGSCGNISKQGTITMSVAQPTLAVTSGTASQSLAAGNSITTIVYTWGGSATGVTVTGLPAGLSGVSNGGAKTYTISGTPTASGTYSLTTTQSSGTAVTTGGSISLVLAKPTAVTATPSNTSFALNWTPVTNATGYTINACPPALKRWDFSIGNWSFGEADADANLVKDGTNDRFNYIPATTATQLKFANGTNIPDFAGLLFTQGGATKLRLGYGTGYVYLNAAGIVVSIPCASGNKITVIAKSGNSAAIDRGFSVTGGTLNTAQSSVNVDASGILTEAAGTGTWVYDATSSAVVITSVTGGMNIMEIAVGTSVSVCTEYTVSGGSTSSYTVTGLTPVTTYTYQIMATGATPAEASGFTTVANVTTTAVASPTLTDPANKTQSVNSSTPIADIVFTWGGSATDVTVAGLPVGVIATKNAGAKTVTLSGSPTATGTYTVTTVGGTGSVVITGTITATLNPPTLTNPANKTQSVVSGTAIADIIFTWGGGATDVTVTGLPAGLTATKNAGAKTVTISGSPTATAIYTVTTIGGTGAAIVITGTITATPPAATLTSPINKSQTIDLGDAIANIVFTWGGGATDVNVTGLPAGLIATKNAGAKTVTISGTPSAVATTTYTVTTVGGTSAAVETGTITVQTPLSCLALVTIPLTSVAAGGTYDMVLFDAPGTTQIKVLGSGVFNAGNSNFVFTKTGLSSGTYTYKLMDGATIIKTGVVILP